MSGRGAVVTELGADLSVELSFPGTEPVHARLTGERNRLTLDVDRPEAFAGRRDAGMVRAVAEGLAVRGIRVRVVHHDVHLVTLGDVRAPWWQRRATGSPHIRVGSWRGAWTSLRSRVGDTSPVLPGADSLPPATMLPLVPTMQGRRRITGTDAPGTGAPRLVLTKQDVWEGERQPVFWLEGQTWTIGSGSDCDVFLPGLDALHARIVRDEHDELFVVPRPGSTVRVHGAVVRDRQVLRTGARLDLGPHTLAYVREEYADHGRPYGGRVGGEAGHQRRQPS
jgi:hypothetical protein